MQVSGWIKLALSAFTAFTLGFGAPLLAVAASIDGDLPRIAWTTALLAGAMAMARDIRGLMELPPVNGTGGAEKKG